MVIPFGEYGVTKDMQELCHHPFSIFSAAFSGLIAGKPNNGNSTQWGEKENRFIFSVKT